MSTLTWIIGSSLLMSAININISFSIRDDNNHA